MLNRKCYTVCLFLVGDIFNCLSRDLDVSPSCTSDALFRACLDSGSDSDSSIFKISDSGSDSDSSKNSLIPIPVPIPVQFTFLDYDSDSDSSQKCNHSGIGSDSGIGIVHHCHVHSVCCMSRGLCWVTLASMLRWSGQRACQWLVRDSPTFWASCPAFPYMTLAMPITLVALPRVGVQGVWSPSSRVGQFTWKTWLFDPQTNLNVKLAYGPILRGYELWT